MRDYSEEYEISLPYLCAFLLGKIKQVIIVGIIVTLIVCAYGYFSYRKSTETTVADSKEGLTEASIEKVEAVYKTYTETIKARDLYTTYNEGNALFYLDAGSVIAKRDMYILKSEALNIFDQFYEITSFSDDEIEQLNEKYEFDSKANDWADIIDVNISTPMTDDVSNYDDNPYTAVLMVYAYGETEEQCDFLLNILKNHIGDIASSTYCSYEIVSTGIYNDTSYIVNKLTTYNNQLTSLNQQIGNLTSPSYLSTEELSYYDSLVDGTADNEIVATTEPFSLQKYLLIGLFGGMICAIAYYSFIFVMRGTINTEEDGEPYGFLSLGYLDYSKSQLNKLEKLQKILKDGKNPKPSLGESIVIVSEAIRKLDNAQDTLFIAYDTNDGTIQKALSDLKENIASDNEKWGGAFVECGNPFTNAKDFESLIHSSSVIFLQELEVSKLENIHTLKKYVDQYQIKMIGTISVRN